MSITNPTGNRLLPLHLADLRASGLTDEQIAACGFRSESDPAAVAKLLNWRGPATDLGPCLCIPFPSPNGTPSDYVRGKPDTPRADRAKSGKVIKYESPVGLANRAYLPPMTRDTIRSRGRSLLITEGEKKAASADQHGFPCVGLVGVYGWQAKRDGEPAHSKRALIPDLAAIDWHGRPVQIVFDSDAADKPEVRRAELHLAEALQRHGADVNVVRLPADEGGGKVGLDDYLFAHGPDELRELIRASTPSLRSETVPAQPARKMTAPPWPENLQTEA